MHPECPLPTSVPWVTSRFWSSPWPNVWTAILLLRSSVWVHASDQLCLCLCFCLSLSATPGGHHVAINGVQSPCSPACEEQHALLVHPHKNCPCQALLTHHVLFTHPVHAASYLLNFLGALYAQGVTLLLLTPPHNIRLLLLQGELIMPGSSSLTGTPVRLVC